MEVEDEKKNLVLYCGKIFGHMIGGIDKAQKGKRTKYRIGLIYDTRQKLDQYTAKALDRLDVIIKCNTNSPTDLQKALMPYQNQIMATTCRSEDQIPLFARVIPNVPYVSTPNTESLFWSSDKIAMRERLASFDKNITPEFKVITDNKNGTLEMLEKDVGFPMIIKPAGLRASQLVTICYHKEELQESLQRIFKKVEGIYRQHDGNGEPKILIEQFMEGELFSLDAYVSSDGKLYFCPLVYIKTGKNVGFDDFFGYMQMTPTMVKPEKIKDAEQVAAKAILALGISSSTAHVELLRTEDGWKVVEVAARVGGFRHMLYDYSHNINHTVNDILIKLNQKPVIPKKPLGYAVAMKFFARGEGRLTKLNGIKKAEGLKSFKHLYVHKKIGDQFLTSLL